MSCVSKPHGFCDLESASSFSLQVCVTLRKYSSRILVCPCCYRLSCLLRHRVRSLWQMGLEGCPHCELSLHHVDVSQDHRLQFEMEPVQLAFGEHLLHRAVIRRPLTTSLHAEQENSRFVPLSHKTSPVDSFFLFSRALSVIWLHIEISGDLRTAQSFESDGSMVSLNLWPPNCSAPSSRKRFTLRRRNVLRFVACSVVHATLSSPCLVTRMSTFVYIDSF